MGLYPAGGKVLFNGKEIKLNDPAAALKDHLAFVSEDRRGVGLLLDESLDWNISFTAMQSKGMFLKKYLNGLGTWAYSYGFSVTAGLAEFAKRICEGNAKLESSKDLFECLSVFTPGARWNGANYIDQNTGVRAKNHMLIYMDTYVFGTGYLPTTAQEVPEKYFKIKFNPNK